MSKTLCRRMKLNDGQHPIVWPSLITTFLLGSSMHGVRLQLEYEKVEEKLRAWSVRSTVVVFGGARICADGPPQHRRWYDQARSFDRLATWRRDLPNQSAS
jgi:hypothetical protein